MTDGVSYNAKDIKRIRGKLADIEHGLPRKAHATMEKSVAMVESQVVGRTPVFLGELKQSIGTDVSGTSLDLRGVIATDIVYGAPVEYGRKPGAIPPIDAIQFWVERKGIGSGQDSRSVAFLIARAIGKRGTKGVFMFKEGWEASEDAVMELWKNLARDIGLTF